MNMKLFDVPLKKRKMILQRRSLQKLRRFSFRQDMTIFARFGKGRFPRATTMYLRGYCAPYTRRV
jgi:hypothetical protein